jgi:hypothetical protein
LTINAKLINIYHPHHHHHHKSLFLLHTDTKKLTDKIQKNDAKQNNHNSPQGLIINPNRRHPVQ